jgi:hypothetical protein
MKAKKGLLAIALFIIGAIGAQAGGDIVPYEEPATTTTANVSRNGPFVGVEGSYVVEFQSDTVFNNGAPTNEGFKGSGASFGINLGAKQNCWRVLLGYEKYSNEAEAQNYDRVFVQGDYFPLDESYSMGNIAVNPYLGLNLGWLNYSTTGTGDKDGLAYGGEAGFTKSFGEKWDLDVGLRYMESNIEDVDHIGTAAVGIHYYY